MTIVIEVISSEKQRYPTAGDWNWTFDPEHAVGKHRLDQLTIKVSDLGDYKYNLLVAIHELVEAILCHRDGISQELVDEWDKQHPSMEEPGDHPSAPYHKQHNKAMAIERMACELLDLDWQAYEARLEEMLIPF